MFLLFEQVLKLLLLDLCVLELYGLVRILDTLCGLQVLVHHTMRFVTPFVKVFPPLLHTERGCQGNLLNDVLGGYRIVESIGETCLFEQYIGPHRFCIVADPHFLSVQFAVAEEGAELVAVQLFCNEKQELVVVLKVLWELY